MGYEVVWKEGEREIFERSAALSFSKPEGIAAAVIKKFDVDMQLFPLEWPTSDRPPFEDVWGAGLIRVRYRVIPARQQIEVLSVTLEPHRDSRHGPNA
jgi:hypothetical protein